ncbi:MAG: ABC transporter substrate-binding protein [candidate division KSB1 bacterium]|nr:ABC transporter substrate-binding protein [candidate division KSB1 bacterium]MDZ7367141.1 ABC transporter substrate-binding protein [candidate division KSB1 bacterium]MDZ7405119.1 ABC transporter substrate-binding protein [candidate division KSB1 bacterium]
MKSSKFFQAAITVIAVITVSCTKQSETIKLGLLGPLTGDAAQWGVPARNGALLAVEEINKAGGVNGKKIDLFVEDDKCEPRDGTTAIRKLIDNDKVIGVIGAVCSSVTLAVAPIAEQSKTLLISPASTNPKITDAGDYIFRVIPTDALRGKVFAEYLKKDVGVSKIAILYINNEGGLGNKEVFENIFKSLGGEVLIVESYAQGTNDVRSQLAKIKKSSAEALMIVSYPEDTIIVLKQIVEVGIKIPLYFQTEAVEDPNVLRIASTAAENVTYILPAAASGTAAIEFRQKYKDKFQVDPPLFAAEAYDAAYLIAKACEAVKKDKIDGTSLKSFLYTVKDFDGASGRISFDTNGDVIKPMAIKKIQGGTGVVIATI